MDGNENAAERVAKKRAARGPLASFDVCLDHPVLRAFQPSITLPPNPHKGPPKMVLCQLRHGFSSRILHNATLRMCLGSQIARPGTQKRHRRHGKQAPPKRHVRLDARLCGSCSAGFQETRLPTRQIVCHLLGGNFDRFPLSLTRGVGKTNLPGGDRPNCWPDSARRSSRLGDNGKPEPPATSTQGTVAPESACGSKFGRAPNSVKPNQAIGLGGPPHGTLSLIFRPLFQPSRQHPGAAPPAHTEVIIVFASNFGGCRKARHIAIVPNLPCDWQS